MSSLLHDPSIDSHHNIHNFLAADDDDDADTASQRSISLSSPPLSPRNSSQINTTRKNSRFSDSFSKRESHPYTVDTDFSSEADDVSMYTHESGVHESPNTSAAPSVYGDTKDTRTSSLTTYPPTQYHRATDDSASISSFASSSSRKARPESMLMPPPNGPIVLGIALVDFNHLVGPRIEYSRGDIFEDEEVAKILPFLALPDGAHLSAEDYSYFHLVPSSPHPTTVFGISCNQQIASSQLLVKGDDVTRSTVQKAVVVLASKPVFGPIRDKLGVVTTALFNQRDFRETSILDDFATSLEMSLRTQLTESGLYMGTNLRELVHTFRQRTLILVKALMLQKRIMFFGHPVEKLCTYQYSLVSLLPGLLQTLDDCGSPPLAERAPTLTPPTSLKTSDRKSMMAYMGLPLDLFGKDSFFQPYLPLQQLDVIKETPSWLCGTTNSIVTQQKAIDLLVNIETGAFEFRNPSIERSAGLTAADRKWMDDIVTDVNASWVDEDPKGHLGIQFKGSDDYLRSKFEEYVSAALASVRYRDFVAKGENSGVLITGGSGGDTSSTEDFNPLWISEFKTTNAFGVWERTTDPMLFDIVEPRHPCNEKPSVVSDIGLRLSEGIQELKLEQQLAPAREAVTRTLSAGTTNFFKAMEGVRERWGQKPNGSSGSLPDDSKISRSSTPVEVSKADLDGSEMATPTASTLTPPPSRFSLLSRQASSSSDSNTSTGSPATATASATASAAAAAVAPKLAAWGAGIGSFLSTRAPRFSLGGGGVNAATAAAAAATVNPEGGKKPEDVMNGGSVVVPVQTPTASTVSSTYQQQSPPISIPTSSTSTRAIPQRQGTSQLRTLSASTTASYTGVKNSTSVSNGLANGVGAGGGIGIGMSRSPSSKSSLVPILGQPREEREEEEAFVESPGQQQGESRRGLPVSSSSSGVGSAGMGKQAGNGNGNGRENAKRHVDADDDDEDVAYTGMAM